MSNISDEILKTIRYALERTSINCDRTYKSVIKKVTPKGYVILDDSGCERTVSSSSIVELKEGQRVWVKEPMGNIKDLHICGIV